MSLYRKLTPAEVLAMVRGKATGGVTPKNTGGDTEPAAVTLAPEVSPSAERRTKNRHKPDQAAYMRAHRARKKAEKAAT